MFKSTLLISIFLLSLSNAQQNGGLQNRFLLGESYFQAGDLQKAREIFEDIHSKDPVNIQYFNSLNRTYLQLKEYDKAVELIRSRLKVFPQNIDLFGQLGSVYYVKGDEKQAFAVWDSALTVLPPGAMNYRVIANYAIERRAFDKAVQYLQAGKKQTDDPLMFSYDLANIFSVTMRFREAAEEYISILSKDSRQLRIIEQRILSYMSRPDALGQTIEVFENARSKKDYNVLQILARLYSEKKDFEKALNLFIELDKELNRQGTDLYNFGNSVYYEGQLDVAARAFGTILEKYPNSPVYSPAKLGMAKTLEAILDRQINSSSPNWKPYYTPVVPDIAKVNEVIAAYEELVKLYTYSEIAVESLLRIGKIKLYKQNNPSEAVKYFNRIIDETPQSQFAVNAHIEMARCWLLLGNFTNSEVSLKAAINSKKVADEKTNYANYLLARLNFYRGNFAEAREILMKNLENLADNSANDAIYLTLMVNPNFNDSLNLKYFAEAELLAEQNNFEKALTKYRLVASNPGAIVLGSVSKLKEAEMELALGNNDKAIELLEAVSGDDALNIYADKALYLLGRIFQYGEKNSQKAAEYYEMLLARFPGSIYLDRARNEILSIRNNPS